MSRLIGACGSLLVHAWLLASMLTPPPPPPKVVHTRIDPEVRMLPAPSEGESGGPTCPRTYRGIGMKVALSGRIDELSAGGPAAQAGLQLGDRLVIDQPVRDRYSIGRVIVLHIERDGARMDVPVRVALICFEEVTP